MRMEGGEKVDCSLQMRLEDGWSYPRYCSGNVCSMVEHLFYSWTVLDTFLKGSSPSHYMELEKWSLLKGGVGYWSRIYLRDCSLIRRR